MKLKKNKIVLIVIVIIVGGLVGIYNIEKSKPKNVIEGNLNLRLPSTSKIINYQYDNMGGYFDAKILIESNQINDIKEQLNNFFGGVSNRNLSEMPNFENTCQWWDLDKNSIETYYLKYVSGGYSIFKRLPKSRGIWAFISKDNEGNYYLYISY